MKHRAHRRTRDDQAFTLIELLIVVAVVAVLVAVLLPVFVSAREKGRRASCASNLRQIGVACRMYVDDYDRLMPANRTCTGPPVPGFPLCAPGLHVSGWMDMLRPYTGSPAVFKCPDDPSAPVRPEPEGYTLSPDGSGRTNRFRCSYGKNNNLGNVPPPAGYAVADGEIPSPTTTIAFFDWAPNMGGGDNGMEDAGAPFNIERDSASQPPDSACVSFDPSRYDPNASANGAVGADQQGAEGGIISSERHGGGANYCFCDGHVQWSRPSLILGQCAFTGAREDGADGTRPDFRL